MHGYTGINCLVRPLGLLGAMKHTPALGPVDTRAWAGGYMGRRVHGYMRAGETRIQRRRPQF